ncbi:MAG: nitroreductase [Acidobacteriia bacterium]|nr:nitroreductase [Terriglobia bacterium]
MELMDVLGSRRAVRDYTPMPVERPTIEHLIHAATLAPSAMNLQPWAFAVLTGQNRIDQLAGRIKSWLLANFSDTMYGPSIRGMIEDPKYTLLHHAPALVMVLAKSQEAQAVEDCCLAAENLMLAARDEGLGSCWVGFARPWINLPEIKKELGLPQNYHVVAPIVLGYPLAWPKSHGRSAPEIQWLG